MAIVNLNKKLNNFKTSKPISRKSKSGKNLLIKAGVIIVILFVALYLPLRSIYSASKQLMRSGKLLVAAAKTEDLDQIKKGVIETKDAIESIDESLNWLFWLRIIPYFGGYYSDAKHLVVAVKYDLKAVESIVISLEPYKAELGFTGQLTAGQDRIAQAVKVLDKVLPNIDKVEPDLKKARDEVAQIDTGKYPAELRSIAVRSRMEQMKDMIMGVHAAVTEGKEALKVAPTALGAPTPKTYLLLFQNDKELRPTGGFLTAYAFLRMDNGKLSTTASDDIYRLDEKLLKVCLNKICPLAPPVPIVKYLPEANGKPRTAWSMRDSNLSPDLSASMKEFEKMYQMLGDGTKFDGIITIDSQVVEELIAITGPIDVFGTTYSANTDKRCNCPNVIYELEHYAEVASKGEEDRKAVLGTLMQQILAKSLGAGPDKMPEFITKGVKLAGDKHIMFYMHDATTQTALSKLNWTGDIKSFEGDYIHINDSNFAGGKSNLYVDEKVTVDIKVDGSGDTAHKVIIEYKNPQPYNIWLNGILRDYVRLYVPRGSKLISSKGSDDPVNTLEDEILNKTYFEAFIQVRPQNSRMLTFEYTVPNVAKGKTLPLLIQKQPGAKDHRYVIKINGSTKAEFDLLADKQLNLSL